MWLGVRLKAFQIVHMCQTPHFFVNWARLHVIMSSGDKTSESLSYLQAVNTEAYVSKQQLCFCCVVAVDTMD